MTRRPTSHGPRHLLERATRQGGLGALHARLQGLDLEFPRAHVRRDIELAGRRERRVGGLHGQGAGIERFGALAGGGGAGVGVGDGAFGGGVEGHDGRAAGEKRQRKERRKEKDGE